MEEQMKTCTEMIIEAVNTINNINSLSTQSIKMYIASSYSKHFSDLNVLNSIVDLHIEKGLDYNIFIKDGLSISLNSNLPNFKSEVIKLDNYISILSN